MIALMLFPLLAFAQMPQKRIFGIEEDKVNHFTAGYMIGFVTTAVTWKFTERKWIAVVSGIAVSSLAGHLKESYDMKHGGFYNNKDLKATVIGGLSGTITIRLLLINIVPKRKVPVYDQWLLDSEESLVKK